MRFISAIYKSRRNFWCMTRGYSQQLNFQLQKVDGEPSGRQNWTKTLDFWFSFYIHFQRDPKGIAFRYIHFPIRTWCTFETPYCILSMSLIITFLTSVCHFFMFCLYMPWQSLIISKFYFTFFASHLIFPILFSKASNLFKFMNLQHFSSINPFIDFVLTNFCLTMNQVD